MITLNEIISSNLQMLDEQENEILKALDFVRRAKSLFQGQGSNPVAVKQTGKRRGRKPSAKNAVSQKSASSAGSRAPRKNTYISQVLDLLKSKNGQSTGDLAQKIFDSQKEKKDFPAFRQNIYNIISQSKKKKMLKSKDGKIFLP